MPVSIATRPARTYEDRQRCEWQHQTTGGLFAPFFFHIALISELLVRVANQLGNQLSFKPRDWGLLKTPLVGGKCVSRRYPSRPRTWAETDPGFDKYGVSTGSHTYSPLRDAGRLLASGANLSQRRIGTAQGQLPICALRRYILHRRGSSDIVRPPIFGRAAPVRAQRLEEAQVKKEAVMSGDATLAGSGDPDGGAGVTRGELTRMLRGHDGPDDGPSG